MLAAGRGGVEEARVAETQKLLDSVVFAASTPRNNNVVEQLKKQEQSAFSCTWSI